MVTRRAAVLGSPISHSRSPDLHRAAYAALGLDWTYDAIEVTTASLADFLDSREQPEWAGLSLTMPLKADVLPMLDEISETAAFVRAVNTVVFTDGRRAGHNTDVAGMQRALQEAHGGDLVARTGAILGSGATARSALVALQRLGVDEVVAWARNPERAADLVALGRDLGVDVALSPWDGSAPLAADVVIATVPPGAADGFVHRVTGSPGVLLDVAYGEGVTPLTAAWRRAGGATADGLDLLLWQAVDQVTLMTGLEAPVAAMQMALRGASETARP
jgi:shikimate dehydrogenase